MKRIPKQAVMPFTRADRVVNRQIRQRASGVKVGEGPGRPKKKRDRDESHLVPMAHGVRVALKASTAVHVTLRVREHVPNLRSRKRYGFIKRAFALANRVVGFRVVHFAVLGNHLHVIAEADSAGALSKGMQSLALSASRSLNADSVRRQGGSLDPRLGSWSERRGWLGRIFVERYHSHVLGTLSEMGRALRYLLTNAAKHYGKIAAVKTPFRVVRNEITVRDHVLDAFCSFALPDDSCLGGLPPVIAQPRGHTLLHAARLCSKGHRVAAV